MDPIDPDRISQLSRRKLRGTASDKDNLRRLVLIQNSLVSISPIASPSRSCPGPADQFAVDDSLKSDDPRFGEIGSGLPCSSSEDDEDDDEEDYGFGYVFPDPSLWVGSASGSSTSTSSSSEDEDEEDEDPELVLVGESDWLDSIISELDDEQEYEEEEEEAPSTSFPMSFHSPYSLRYQSHGPARVPLPSITPYESDHLPISSEESEDDPDAPPNFDQDEGSSVYSDESLSELATPLSHSLLRAAAAAPTVAPSSSSPSSSLSGQRISVVSHSRHNFARTSLGLADDEASPEDDSPLSAAVLPEIVVNATSVRDALKNASYRRADVTSSSPEQQMQQAPQQLRPQHQHNPNDYFSCHYFRGSYDSF